MPEQINKLIHAFSALADLGAEIAESRNFDEMVRATLHVALGALGLRRGAVAEYEQAAAALRFVALWGMGEAELAAVSFDGGRAELLGAGGGHVLACGESGAQSALQQRLGAELTAALTAWRVSLVVPLVVHGELVGLLALGGKATEEEFTVEECEVVRTMARHIGVGIHNHRLLRELEARAAENQQLYDILRSIYRDTVRAFAAAIDCKDKYTQGHSERVGKYSEIIARELGWSDDQIEGVAVGGYLHDVGKLVVERDIINAPYRIDAKQSSELNRHPAAGYEILAPIRHPDADIPLMAKYHHERIDGRGYPEGLTGDEIPLAAKVVALADSFDAMTTDRTYRRRKEFPEVVADLRQNTGKQFAPEVVIAFCRALLKELDGDTKERRISRMLGKGYLDSAQVRPLLIELIAELEAATHATARSV
ncbi:MAG TPA: HD domain-containing phosphohydrolase [Pyrinomonadaceae bacterium]